jgi:hypothetical protein
MKRIIAAAMLVITLVACNPDDLKIDSQNADVVFGKDIITKLQEHKFEDIEPLVEMKDGRENLRGSLENVANMLTTTAPDSMDVVGKQVFYFNGTAANSRRVELAMQYNFEGKWFLIVIRSRSDGGKPSVIEWLKVTPMAASLSVINEFTFANKGGLHYAMLAYIFVAVAITLYALVLCIRTRMPGWRKVLWIVGILIGVVQINLNWTTGAFMIQPLTVQLFSAGFIRMGEFAPVILQAAVPLFAIMFLVKHARGTPPVTEPT